MGHAVLKNYTAPSPYRDSYDQIKYKNSLVPPNAKACLSRIIPAIV